MNKTLLHIHQLHTFFLNYKSYKMNERNNIVLWVTVLQRAAQWMVSFLSTERCVTTMPSVLRTPTWRRTPAPAFTNILRLSTVVSKKVDFSSYSDLLKNTSASVQSQALFCRLAAHSVSARPRRRGWEHHGLPALCFLLHWSVHSQ